MEEYGMIILVAMFAVTLLTGIRIGGKDSFEKGREIGREEGRIQERNEMKRTMAQMRVKNERVSGFEACRLYEMDEKRA